MDEMVKKVADAILAVCEDMEPWRAEEAARAAIEAMREPTEAMMWSGENALGRGEASVVGSAPVPIYRAMIDAALKG